MPGAQGTIKQRPNEPGRIIRHHPSKQSDHRQQTGDGATCQAVIGRPRTEAVSKHLVSYPGNGKQIYLGRAPMDFADALN